MRNLLRYFGCIFILLVMAATARSQGIDSARAFFPLEIGNEWQYEELSHPRTQNSYEWRRVVGDTVLPNGIRYFVIATTEGVTKGFPRYVRFDSTSGEFMGYDDDYDAERGLFMTLHPDQYSIDTLLGITVASYTIWPRYRYMGFAKLAYGIGIADESHMDPFTQFTTNWHLIYAKVGGREYGTPMSVKTEAIDRQHMLEGNAPNPVTSTTSIRFSIPRAGSATLKVLDPLGVCVATLVNERKDAGSYVATFDARELPNGIYFYQLTTDDGVLARPMVVAR